MQGIASQIRRHSHAESRAFWPGTAFLVEALVLLVFLVWGLAVFTNLFSASRQMGAKEEVLQQSVTLASNAAEQFSTDPTGTPDTRIEGDYTVSCNVTPQTTSSGTLYKATISVFNAGEEIYSIKTARYVSGGA